MDTPACIFCGKDDSEVDVLVASANGIICDRCISLLQVVLHEWKRRQGPFILKLGEDEEITVTIRSTDRGGKV